MLSTSTERLAARGGWARNGKTLWHRFAKLGPGGNTHALCGVYLAEFTDLEEYTPLRSKGVCPRCKHRLDQIRETQA